MKELNTNIKTTIKKKMKTIKKVSLKKKEKSLFDSAAFFFSGYALTDNKNFAHFGVKKLPRLNISYKKFSFDENNLTFSLDTNIVPVVNKNKVSFEDYFIDIMYYNYFLKLKEDLQFFKLKEFLGKETTNKILIMNKLNKPIGVLNLQKGEKLVVK